MDNLDSRLRLLIDELARIDSMSRWRVLATANTEREGFEPSVQFPIRILSKDVPSATRPSLHTKLSVASGLFLLLGGPRAEREGFEPPVSYPTTVFKTAALNHSAISPKSISFPIGERVL